MSEPLSNKEISQLIKLTASLMELHGENDFKVKTYANAAFQIGRFPNSIFEMDKAALEQTKGIGKSVAARIIELKEMGRIPVLDDLMLQTPEGVIDMLRIKGLGAKKVAVIWKELGVESTGELLYACSENRLLHLKGFGDKTQKSVIEAIEYLASNQGKWHYAAAYLEALSIEKNWNPTLNWSRCGEFRRENNVVSALEWITTESIDHFTGVSWQENDSGFEAVSEHGLPLYLYTVPVDQYTYQLFQRTGSSSHIKVVEEKLNGHQHFVSENDLYQQAKLPYIEPSLREDLAEWKLAENHQLNSLIEVAYLKGAVHNHSTWSDGKHSIREMAEACLSMGLEYLVMSDHSKTAVYAGGLSIERVHEQHREIEALNAELAPFKIFKSIESDILNDGSLDYPDEVLAQFDLVIASVHQNLRMDAEKANARLLRAIENPFTDILGHLTGRLLLSRPGYPINHRMLIDACAHHGVAIEINANPYRLDIDYTFIPYALEKGVWISVNPDAHSKEGLSDMYFGVRSARKGGLLTASTLNALNLDGFNNWVLRRKATRQIG